MQTPSLDAGLFRSILHSSLSFLNTSVEGVHLIRTQTVHKVALLPTGHQDRHLGDTGGLSFFEFTVRYRIFQSQSPVWLQYWFSVVSAEQLADLLLEHDAALRRHFTSPAPTCSS